MAGMLRERCGVDMGAGLNRRSKRKKDGPALGIGKVVNLTREQKVGGSE